MVGKKGRQRTIPLDIAAVRIHLPLFLYQIDEGCR